MDPFWGMVRETKAVFRDKVMFHSALNWGWVQFLSFLKVQKCQQKGDSISPLGFVFHTHPGTHDTVESTHTPAFCWPFKLTLKN